MDNKKLEAVNYLYDAIDLIKIDLMQYNEKPTNIGIFYVIINKPREDEYFEIANARVNKLENPLKQWEQWI